MAQSDSDLTMLGPGIDEEIRLALTGMESAPVTIYNSSIRERDGGTYLLARIAGERRLLIMSDEEPSFAYDRMLEIDSTPLYVCPESPENAERLRQVFPWAGPEPLGRTSAVGCGDRLGLATPGHIRACCSEDVVPVLAQQSIREMERTGRSPQEVLDDVTWAVFQEGFTAGFGADADHLKQTRDIDTCLTAGYTMYTIDPSDHVDNAADRVDEDELEARFRALPWDELDTPPDACLARYAHGPIDVETDDEHIRIEFDEEAVKRAAIKYGAALAHTARMAEYLADEYEEKRPGEEYDLELSVDETSSPTTPREHYFVAAELDRLGVDVTGLAPRFVGDFEKGIDYVGDLAAFERSFQTHATIAKSFGGYKLSIHSGSDKFSVFPIIGRYAGDHVHLKTAGTSFLEALRIPARHDPTFFRQLVNFAFSRFEEDRTTYHVTTNLNLIPEPEDISDVELEETYLEENNARQLLHITYGSILSASENGHPRFRTHLFQLLRDHEDEHFEALTSHFVDHIRAVRETAD